MCIFNKCSSNSECGGHQPTCSNNTFNFTPVEIGHSIRAFHINELQTAINQERTHPTRRCAGTQPACQSNCPSSYNFNGVRFIGDIIRKIDLDRVIDANNGCAFGYNITRSFGYPYGGTQPNPLIRAIQITIVQNAINQTRQNCICNTYCSCNINCNCNTYTSSYGCNYHCSSNWW